MTAIAPFNIVKFCGDPLLGRAFLEDRKGSIKTWANWGAAMRVLYGLPLPPRHHDLVRTCTGREPALLPLAGFDVALFLTGRRSGKSRMAAVIGAYEACLAGHEHKLAKGEKGMVGIFSPSKRQSHNVKNYLRAAFDTPLLRDEVIAETREGFELRNGNLIEILAGDFRTVRGFTLIAAIVDECAFFGVDEELKIKSDTELITAIEPGLATVGGKLIAITTPYARAGWCYNQHQRHHGNDNGTTLVWNCPSRTMNPTLSQATVDKALADDLAKGKSEYLGEFRDNVAAFLSREAVQAVVVPGRIELPPESSVRYGAFVDVSGGRSDDAALAIGHGDQTGVVVDVLRRYRPPFNPQAVIGSMARELRRFGISRAVGDAYSAGFVVSGFRSHGIQYALSSQNKAGLYAELLPRICSRQIELPDDPVLVTQLASLERRTRSGGRDIIDHPPGQHDDLANAIAGLATVVARPRVRIGAAF